MDPYITYLCRAERRLRAAQSDAIDAHVTIPPRGYAAWQANEHAAKERARKYKGANNDHATRDTN